MRDGPIRRQQRPALSGLAQRAQCLQRHHGVGLEGLHIVSSQARQASAGPERARNVLAEHAHIGAAGADDLEVQLRGSVLEQLQPLEVHLAWRALHRDPAAREPIERLTVALERRIHRRDLLLAAQKALQYAGDPGLIEWRHRTALDDLTLCVARRGTLPEPQAEAIRLAPVQQLPRQPCRLPEADRQHAARQRIQAPAMPGLDATGQPAYDLQRGVRGQADGLVEQQHAGA